MKLGRFPARPCGPAVWRRLAGGAEGIRTLSITSCKSLNFRGVFNILATEKPVLNPLFVLDFCAQGSGTVVRSRDGKVSTLHPPPGDAHSGAWGGGRPRKARGPQRRTNP